MVDPRDDAWQLRLKRDGYSHFRWLCGSALIAEARAAIDTDLAGNHDPARQIEYDNLSYCPALRRAPCWKRAELPQNSTMSSVSTAWGITTRRSRCAERTTRAQSSRPTRIPTGCRHRTRRRGERAGVEFHSPDRRLSELDATTIRGNFTVWPGSHHVLERNFRERGVETLRSGMPGIHSAHRCN
jgi:hypothetical protein